MSGAPPPHGPRPPRSLERLLEAVLPRGLSGQATLGDLAEEYARRARRSGLRARLWYAGQVASLLAYRALTGHGTGDRSTDSDLRGDLRWSARMLLRRPGFALGVVSVLGLGLGASVAVYSVVDGTLESTTWWAEPDRTVAVWPEQGFSFGMIDLYRQEQAVYRTVGGYQELAYALATADGTSTSVNGVALTPALFRELAVQPVLGRPLADDDALLGVEPVAVIGEGLWRRAFGGDPAVLGRTIDVGGRATRVVGIQPSPAAAPGGRAQIWLPLVMDPRDDDFWRAQSHTVVGVLRDGASMDDAFADLMAFTRRQSELFPMFYPEGYADGIARVARADETQRALVRAPLLLLLAGTVSLLLVTALNVGTLLLGRAIDRRRELAIRTSLGAAPGRIVTQLLVEGSVLTGAALGVALVAASFGGRTIAGLFSEQAVVTSSPVLEPAVLAFGLGASGLAWLVLSGVPVVHFLRHQRTDPSRDPDSGSGMQRGLVTAQAAVATLLLVAATLLTGTVDDLRSVPLGFDPEGMTVAALSPPEDRVTDPAAARELYERLVERAASLPGVRAAGLTAWLPLRESAPSTPVNLESDPVDPREAIRVPMHQVDPGFFEVFGVRPLEGRLLDITDRADVPGAVVVNRSLAEALWPDGSAVGQRIAVDPHAWYAWAPVVGVVPDIRSDGIEGRVGPALYVALAESPARDVTLVVRGDGDLATLAPALRGAVAEVDRLVPVRSVAAMEGVVRSAYATAWVMMGLLLVLAGLSTVLGALGIYAVLSHHVALKRREIGVRMALGAQPGTVVAGVVRTGVLLAALGIALGSLAALLSTRFLASLPFGVAAPAPWAYLAPALGLAAAAAVAAWVPAARAGSLPPAQVLQRE